MQPFPHPNDASDKIWFLSAGLGDIHVWKCGQTDARMDAGSSPIL